MHAARLDGFRAIILGCGVLAAVPAVRGGSIQSDVQDLIAKAGFQPADVAVAIINDHGETAVSLNASAPFQPASNQKVLTTAAALSILGPGHEYETTLTARAPIQNGRIGGDLTIRGTGDPNISSRFYAGGPATLFRSWAHELHEKGLRRVEGDIVADDTYFDDERLPPSWDARQQETWYSAQVSALSLNDNCLDVVVRPAATEGKRARVELIPACPLFQMDPTVETTSAGETRVIVHRKPGTNRVDVSGTIRVRAPAWSGNVTFDDPALVFASTVAAALAGEGITIDGKVRKADREGDRRAGTAPAAASAARLEGNPVALVRHTSTLLQDLPIILKRSQNLHAELLLKALGARAGGEGSLKGGERAVRRFLKAKGIPEKGLVLSDGSGLSHENRVSADLLARVLHSVRAESYFDTYLKSLPLAGKDGTLEKRFRGASPVRGNLYAKTGYIQGVSCLSGYVVKAEKVWCFSILVNRVRGGARPAKALEEKIGELIYARM